MIVLLIVVAVVAVGALAAAAPQKRARPRPSAPAAWEDDDPVALAQSDPVEALLRYGTPETAEHLRAQGVDLGALGYRGGDEN